ncbi:unnamed protein product [Closterium sp. NIES-53]
MFQHIKDLVELDDSGPKAWKLLRDVIQPNTLPMVIVLEKELAALSMRPGDDVKPVLDKIKDTYARMAAAGSNVSQMQHGRMRSAFKRYKLLKLAMGEEKMSEEGDARDRWIEKSAVLYDLILQSVNNYMFQHIKDLVELDDSGPKAWKLLRDVIQPNTLPMVIVLEKELAALSMRPGDDMQQCTNIILVLDNSWDNLIPTLNTQQDQWTPEWLRQQILQEDFRRRHTGGGAANKTAEGYGAAGGSRGRGGGRGRGDYNEGHGSSGKANPGMFLMVEDVKGSEGDDVGSVGKVVMHPLTHWVIDSGALLPVIGVGNAKVMGANGGLVGLGNVLLVEGLSANLLSVRRLQKSKAKVTFGPTSCRAKLGKLLLWDLEEKSSCIKDLWQLPIIPWNGKPPATAAAAAMAKATTGGEETAATAKATAASAPTYGALDAVKKVQQPQQPHGEVLAGVDATAAWAKASSGNGDADWETWHKRLCHINIPMLQKLVMDGSLKGLEVKGAAKEIGSCPTCLETKFTKFPFSSGTGPAKAPLALVHMDVVGPTRAPSLSGSRYFLTIVDDHTLSLADPTRGPVVARASTVLLCPRVPSGSLSGLHLPTFSTNLVSNAAIEDVWVDSFIPGGQRVAICTCSWTGRHLATFTRRPGSSLYKLTTASAQVAEAGQVAASSQVSASGQLVASCSCQRAAPHSSEFPPTTAPLQNLHMDVWGPAPVGGTDQERYFLLLRERFSRDFPVLRLHSDRGAEFSSDLLAEFCRDEGIVQSFTLPASPQQNGIAERRIGLIMEVARTSMIHAAAPHFMWSFAVRYAAHELNLWPRVSEPVTSPTLRWMGKVGDASVFRVWGALSLVHDAKASKLSSRTLRCVFLSFPTDAPPWQFYHPHSCRVFSSHDVTFDKSFCFYTHTCPTRSP